MDKKGYQEKINYYLTKKFNVCGVAD